MSNILFVSEMPRRAMQAAKGKIPQRSGDKRNKLEICDLFNSP
jgi:hypothetical protein